MLSRTLSQKVTSSPLLFCLETETSKVVFLQTQELTTWLLLLSLSPMLLLVRSMLTLAQNPLVLTSRATQLCYKTSGLLAMKSHRLSVQSSPPLFSVNSTLTLLQETRDGTTLRLLRAPSSPGPRTLPTSITLPSSRECQEKHPPLLPQSRMHAVSLTSVTP